MKTPILVCASLAALLSSAVFGQAGAAPPAFDVASVKPSAPSTDGRIMRRMGGDAGMVNYTNVTLKMLIARAYDVKDYQVSGPDWLDSEGYDVVAKIPPGTPKDQLLLMWQTLLAERFKLTLHRETKTLPMYALIVGKNGPKLKEADVKTDGDGPASGGGGAGGGAVYGGGRGGEAKALAMGGRGPGVRMMIGPNGRQLSGAMTMVQLATALGNLTGRPVTDMTGLKGVYDVDLNWTPDDREQGLIAAKMAVAGGAAPSGVGQAHPASEASDSGPTIFGAVQEKLGLKLDPRKGPVEILVIDHADKVPVEN